MNTPPATAPTPNQPHLPRANRRLKPLPPRSAYLAHVFRNMSIAAAILFGSLLVGTLGYHFTEGLAWIDSLLNASMILTGMGPVDHLQTTAGKLFATAYALFSGVAFLSTMALILTPVARRALHRLDLEVQADD